MKFTKKTVSEEKIDLSAPICENLQKACEIFETIIFTLKEKSSDSIDLYLLKKELNILEKKIQKGKRYLEDIDNLIPIKKVEENDGQYLPFQITISKMENGNIYRIVQDRLLPHRITYDKSENKLKYDYIRHELKNTYVYAIEAYEKENGKVPVYEDKIIVFFLNHIPETFNILDLDNLDQKPFIDGLINKHFVPDDNCTKIAYYMEAVVDNNITMPYTEAFVGTKDVILSFIFQKNIHNM